jgi:PAS domain S-box-containing protein
VTDEQSQGVPDVGLPPARQSRLPTDASGDMPVDDQPQTRQQAAVLDLGMLALRGTETSHLYAEAVGVVTRVLNVDMAAVFKLEGDDLVLRAVDPARDDLVDTLRLTSGDGSQAGFTLQHGEPVVVSDTAGERRFRPRVEPHDRPVRSAITVIVPGPLRPYGVLGAYDTRVRHFDADEVRFVQLIANVVGAAAERRRAEHGLQRVARRLELAEDAARMGVWEWNVRTDQIEWSMAMRRLFGQPADTPAPTFDEFIRYVHPDERDMVRERVGEALERGGYETEYRIVRDDGQVRWTVARGEPIRDDTGAVVAMVGISLDITERKAAEQERMELLTRERAARAQAEQARERLSFLASATNALAGSLDEHTTLATLTRLAVPAFADACMVDLVGEDGQLRNVASAHHDAGKQAQLRRFREEAARPRPSHDPRWAVLRSGQSQVFRVVPEEIVREAALSVEHVALMEQGREASVVVVPLPARGRFIGVLSYVREATRSGFEPDDVALAEELGRRAAVAIDNARLYEETRRTGQRFRRMAETLQSSLLPPELPDVEGLDLAATYLPAAEGVAVGGDFYDVFQLAAQRWGIVIGDVQGKGTEAATLTGLVRHTVRTAAIRQGPSRTLQTLNEVIVRGAASDEDGGRFCTILHGRMEPTATGTAVELVSGGHPPALVRRADGRVERLGGGGSLMGLFTEISLHRETTTLGPGDAMVLYTDGVIEARQGDAEFGESGLARVLHNTAPTTAAMLAKAIEEAVAAFSQGRMRDDVALLVVHVPS